MEFIFDVSPPLQDFHFLSLMDPKETFATLGNDDWKEDQIKKLGWRTVEMPDELFSSSSAAMAMRRLILVFQAAIQYCVYRRQLATMETGRVQSKLKSAKEELADMFDEVVELREAAALGRLRNGADKRKSRNSRQVARPQKASVPLAPSTFSCFICGNEYPSSGPLESHLRKRHSITSDLAQRASAKCSTAVYHAAVQRDPTLEVQQAQVREFDALRGDVGAVKESISTLMKVDNDLQKELEASRVALATSMNVVQQLITSQQQTQRVPVQQLPPQQIQVIMPKSTDDRTDELLQLRAQQTKIEFLEQALLELRREGSATRRHDEMDAADRYVAARQASRPPPTVSVVPATAAPALSASRVEDSVTLSRSAPPESTVSTLLKHEKLGGPATTSRINALASASATSPPVTPCDTTLSVPVGDTAASAVVKSAHRHNVIGQDSDDGFPVIDAQGQPSKALDQPPVVVVAPTDSSAVAAAASGTPPALPKQTLVPEVSSRSSSSSSSSSGSDRSSNSDSSSNKTEGVTSKREGPSAISSSAPPPGGAPHVGSIEQKKVKKKSLFSRLLEKVSS